MKFVKHELNIIIPLIVFFSACYSRNNLLPSRQKNTVATLIKLDVFEPHGGSYDEFEYFVNGKSYKYIRARTIGFVLGEKFQLVYDSLFPNKLCSLLLYKPVFLKEEKTNLTIGRVSYVKKNYPLIEYDYQVNNQKYHRIQHLEKEAKFYPQISKNALYVVEYLIDNSQRSVIYFDELVTVMDTAVATVIEPYQFNYVQGPYCEYTYVIQGDTFKEKSNYDIRISKGERFRMVFFTFGNKQVLRVVNFYEPVFLENEITKITSGEVIFSQKNAEAVYYKYNIDGKQYERAQILNGKVKDYKMLKDHKTFKVEYLVDNPQRAIIYLDQPIK